MDFKGAVLFYVLLTGSTAIGKDATEETTMLQLHLDARGDSSFQNPAKTSEKLETNKKFEDLIARIEHLEDREKAREHKYMNEIDNLRRQLSIQTRCTSSLERLIKTLWNKNLNHVKLARDEQENILNDDEEMTKSSTISTRDAIKRSQGIRRAETDGQVAFYATLTQHLTQVGAHQPITFNNVITNIGNAYNKHFGSFIAPVPGTYVFSATLFTDFHNDYKAQFVRNGQLLSNFYMRGSDSGHATMSVTTVLQLQRGDDVGIQNTGGNNSIHGDNYSSFAGFLLQEDFSKMAVVGK